MALVVKDRVKEVTTTTGTSNLTLGGAVYGFQSFSVIGNGNTTYYGIYDSATGDWEVGVGTYSTTGPTLTRDTVLESSNSGSKVVFGAGTKDVFVTYPAERSVYLDAAGSAVTVLDVGTLGVSTANISTANITAGTISTTPTSSNDLVNKTYVDAIAAQGISYHTPVKYEVPSTTGNLNATYNNGASGVGATLTNAGTQAPFAPDGPTAQVGDRILIYNQTNAAQNGVYQVTVVGTASTNWVLTRTSDANTYGVKDPNALGAGDAFYVTSGNTGAGETYVCNTAGTITFGTTAITFAQISSAQVYSAGTGLTLSNLQFSITPVGTAGTYGSASSVPVFTTNASGQVSSVTNTAIAISAGAVSGLAASATTDTTNASNITTGTLGSARLTGSYTGITGVGTLTAGTWNASTIGATFGGTGLTTYAQGDLLYATSSSTLGRLADVATGNALISGGVGGDPAWGKIGLQTHVDGTLQVTNGGTGATTLTGYVYGNGTGAFTASTSIPNSATTATSANTASAIVARDGSGNFSAGTITASLSGNASTATSATSATTATNLAGGVAGAIPYQSGSGTTLFSAAGTSGQYLQSNGTSAPSWSNLPAVNNGTLTLATSGTGLSGSATFTANQSGNSTFTVTSNATSGNTASTIVARDASGNFSAGTITAALSGNASTATTATTANALNAANSYIGTGFTAAAGTAYIVANRTSSASGQVGYNWAQGGSNLWWNFLDTNATTLSWYNSVAAIQVMTLTTGGALNTAGAITQNGSQVLTAGNYNSYAPTLTGTGASGTWGINVTGNAATATTLQTARTINGTSFNGSANITTSSWGTARDINGTSVDGSANYAIGRIYDTNYRRITNPGGAEYVTTTASVTGAIAVTLPVGMTGSMVRITIKIYEYTTNESFEVCVGGYNYFTGVTNTWVNNPFAYIIGNPGTDLRYAVRLGYNSTSGKAVIYIGELSTVWSYPQVFVTEVQLGYSGQSVNWTTGWSIGFEASAFQNVTATINNSQVGYAVSTNTANSTVLRDGSGNFSAGTITAALSGNASTATTATNLAGGSAGTVPYQSAAGTTVQLAAGSSGQVLTSNGAAAPSWTTPATVNNGTLTLNVSGTGLSGSQTFTANQAGNATFTVTSNATSANTASTIVARDASGNFSAGTITATLSGNASSATYVAAQDIRTISPSSTPASRLGFGFTSWANNNTSPWADYLALRSYTDATGGNDNLLLFNKNTIAMRLYQQAWGSASAYSSFADVLLSNNYNSYAPTLTGGGASGTWGINITGNAATASNTSSISNAVGGNYTWTGTQYFTSVSNTGSSSGDADLQAYSTGGAGAIMSFHRAGVYAINMGLDSDNVFRIGGWSASANRLQMDMSGNLTMAANVTAHSDERLKKDWEPVAEDFVERLAEVKSGTYTRIDIGERQAGSSAQDWQKLLPEVVRADNQGTLSLAYGNAALVACVELAKEVLALRAEIQALKEQK